MKNTCIQCGKEFELSDNEINFYKNKKLELPKRCKECRQKNRRNDSVQSTGKYNYDGTSGRYHKKTGYINNSKHSSSIIIGMIALLILLFAGGYYANQFLHESRDSRTPAQSQEDMNAHSYESRDSGTSEQSQEDMNAHSHETKDSEKAEQSQKDSNVPNTEYKYQFRNDEYLAEHFKKHGSDFGYQSKEEYIKGANKVIFSSDSLHKQEAEDGDDVYFLKSSGGLVIVSIDGYIRTYFKPDDGIDYFNRQ